MLFSGFDAPNKTEWADRGWYVVTEFERTPSINFRRAVELAKAHPGFTPLMDERNILIYRNIYRQQDLLRFQEMSRLIKNWKGAKLYLKGERIEFDMLGSGVQCYIRSVLEVNDSQSPSDQCKIFVPEVFPFFGCIGCRRSHVSMEWNATQPPVNPIWFAFGRLDHYNVYHILKEELESAVIGELIEYRYCPLLNLKEIREFIRQLPERIDPRKDKEWKYRPGRKRLSSSRQFHGIAVKKPDIFPISEEAYSEYLKRKLS